MSTVRIMPNERLLEEAIVHYHDLVASSDIAEAQGELVAELDRRSLFFGERRVCTVLRPHFVTRDQLANAAEALRLLGSAFEKVTAAAVRDPRLMEEELGLTSLERRLAEIDPGYPSLATTSRLDGFYADELRFMEYNAESPAAVAYQDEMAEAFLAQPLFQRFQERYAAEHLWIRPHLVRSLLRDFRDWGGSGTPNIAIVDWRGVPTRFEFELCRREFERHGLPTTICDPRELTFLGGRLRWEEFPIDLVYKRVLTSELLDQEGEETPLLQAYRAHAVCVCNSFRVKIVHKKALFALMTDERYASLFTADESAAIGRHIPWTRIVREQRTTRGGEAIDLIPYIREHRDEFVLKPNDEYGGKGVVVGWEATGAEWDGGIEEALRTPRIVQERIPVPRAVFPRLEPTLTLQELSVDLDPYLIGGRLAGLLTRLAATTLLNVTAGGGSAAPTFVVDRRD